MKSTITLIMFGLLGTASAMADAPMVYCECNMDAWPPYYAYPVDAASFPMISFSVGTNDLNPDHYTDVTIPPGWNFAIVEEWTNHAHGVHTPHGEDSPGPCWCLTAGQARWWTDDPDLALEFFTFSFHHPWYGEDTAFHLLTQMPGAPGETILMREYWDAPVGMGYGPLHGPYADYCWSSGDCADGLYCLFDACAAETGRCVPQPEAGSCPEYFQPVCGCDGAMYVNACAAAAAGVSFDHPGTCLPGDLNCSNELSLADINPFILALTDPDQYYQSFPLCWHYLADCNGDDVVDFKDINPFVLLLAR